MDYALKSTKNPPFWRVFRTYYYLFRYRAMNTDCESYLTGPTGDGKGTPKLEDGGTTLDIDGGIINGNSLS